MKKKMKRFYEDALKRHRKSRKHQKSEKSGSEQKNQSFLEAEGLRLLVLSNEDYARISGE